MNPKKFYLLVDTSVICSYLVAKWIAAFGLVPEFQGVIVKEEIQPQNLLDARNDFHAQYSSLDHREIQDYPEMADLYPSPDQTEQSMIKNHGIAKYSTTGYEKTIFIGSDLNGERAKKWLMEVSDDSNPLIFVCATQILKPWWVELTNSKIFNCHSAVLPYARGMYAIENIAIREDIQLFKKAAGATVHYLDEGIDTGAIIRAQRIIDPFQFDSIWDLKAYSYLLGFDLYVKTAQDILADSNSIPVGITPDPKLQGPNFLIKDFTLERQRQAERSYLLMKSPLGTISND